jgi:hypothetical protein
VKNFKTEHPFVVTTKGGSIKSRHYSSEAAVAASKSATHTRLIFAMHRGNWLLKAGYRAGKAWSQRELDQHLQDITST